MLITALVLLALYAAVVVVMSARANRRLSRRASLPMQWGLDGTPTWSLPRRAALIVMPILGGLPLAVGSAFSILAPDRINSPYGLMTTVGLLAVVGVVIEVAYLLAVLRWDRKAPL